MHNLDCSEFHEYMLDETLYAKIYRSRLQYLESMAIREIVGRTTGMKVSLSLSFGKDSMTCLHLAHKAGLLDQFKMVLWSNSGIETDDTFRMRDYVVDRYQIRNYVEAMPPDGMVEKTLSGIDPDHPKAMVEFVYHCLERPRWAAMDDHDIDMTILGLRETESKARKINMRMRGSCYYNRREKAQILTPVVKWTVDEIFGYAAMEQIPLHPVYSKKMKLGFHRHKIRHNTAGELHYIGGGDIMSMRSLYPKTYRQLIELMPTLQERG